VDPRRLKRVAVNLLTNVARYTPPEARVWLRAGADGEAGLWISVADDGPGVPADALPRLFDPFFRAEGSRSKATGGLGLGLMLVRQIADAHGGRVEAQPRAGGGLEVRLWLPRRPG
jgi:signal transduction histidine kinase